MKSFITAGVIALGIASIFAITATIYLRLSADEEVADVKWDPELYYAKEGPPPEPVFNNRDDEECRDVVNDFFTSATNTYRRNRED